MWRIEKFYWFSYKLSSIGIKKLPMFQYNKWQKIQDDLAQYFLLIKVDKNRG